MCKRARVLVDGLLLVTTAALSGATAALHPVPATVGAAVVLVLLRHHATRLALLVAGFAFALSMVRAEHTLREYRVARLAMRDVLHAPLRCAVRGRVVESPVQRGEELCYVAELSELDCEGRQIGVTTRARLYGGPPDLARGDEFEAVAQLAVVRLFQNIGISDSLPYLARQGTTLSGSALAVDVEARGFGVRASIDRARAHVRRRIRETFAPDAEAMARALVLGENDLDSEDSVAFKKSGLAHLLAVSGTHLVFAVVALVRALAFVLVRIERLAVRCDTARLAAALGAVLSLLYADFAGGTGSAWRAAFMLAAALTVRALGRRLAAPRALALSLGIGALLDPLAAFDVSFLLSAAATTGLLLVGQPLARPVKRLSFWPLRYLAESVIATVSSMLPCAPLLALLSSELTIAGILANVFAAPFGELFALPLCLAHCLLAPFAWLEHGTALVASGALLVVKKVAHLSAAATALHVYVPPPEPWHFVLLAVCATGFALSRDPRARVRRILRAGWLLSGVVALTVVELAAHRAGNPKGVVRVTFVDVGQGDSLLVDLPDGRLMLIDGGGFVGSPLDPGEAVVAPLLRARRRSRVDIAVLTHPHPDHFIGLTSALRHVEVGELWDSGQGEAEGAGPVYASLIADARQRGVPILRPGELCARPRHFGSARVDVLGPCPAFVRGRSGNDNSIVLRVTFGQHVALLVGDAEEHQERELIEQHGPKLEARVLKVGHHGSKTSSGTPFLAAVRPAYSIVSTGVRNRYGHPHPYAMARLAAAGGEVLRTDTRGGVIWQTDGQKDSVRTARPEE